jgi:hypothetical protein
MANAPETARLTPAGERLLDMAVRLSPLLAKGNLPATLRYAKEIEHALRPPLSRSQIDWLIGVVEWTSHPTEQPRAGVLATLRALRAELNKGDADAGA